MNGGKFVVQHKNTHHMKLYYVNKKSQPNGDHEVHTSECKFLPSKENRKYLGLFSTCKEAVEEAKKTYKQSDGCFTCSNECHTK